MCPFVPGVPFIGPAVALLLALTFTALSPAQPPTVPAEKGFVRARSFDMPFNLPPATRATVREIKLYVKPEPGGDWQLHATASPAQTKYNARSQLQEGSFEVRQDRDGTFAFAIMSVFSDNTSDPPSVDQLRPDQKVTIDTRPPTITLKPHPVKPRGDGRTVVGVQWKVEDEHLVKASVRLEGRWFGAVAWTNFFRETGPEEDGSQEWTLPAGQRMEVRLIATDRAGNQAVGTLLLPGAGTMTGNSASRDPSQPNFRLVSTKSVKLQYRVRERPPSGLASIDLWFTRVGHDWKKSDKRFDAPKEDTDSAEIDFDATEDGTYGFTMVATSNAGMAQSPPKSNDPPQIWIEVDTTKPETKLKTVKLSQPNDARSLVLEWTATDKNIEVLPIIFEYAEVTPTKNDAKWQELTTPLPNSGRYVCATPQLSAGAYQFKVRMNVFDKAGNVFTIEHDKPISVDVVRPQVEITDVKTNQPPK